MIYSVSLSDQAKAFFEEATADLQKRLDRGFDQLKLTPYRHSQIKSLKGKLAGYYRYRVGDYRVIYRVSVGWTERSEVQQPWPQCWSSLRSLQPTRAIENFANTGELDLKWI